MNEAPAVCKWLRARSGYGRPMDDAAWQAGESPVESYWCLCTMEPVGPDDRLVHAHDCRPGRSCYAAKAG